MLTEADNYLQIEKEGLACAFGIQRFNSYMFGRHFILQNDHKPLLLLFNEQPLPPQASNRIQRWALKLATYDYSIIFQSTKQHANANTINKVPLEGTPVETQTTQELVHVVQNLQEAPITARQIAHWT